MERDDNDMKAGQGRSNPLQDFIAAYRPTLGKRGTSETPDSGLGYWEVAREAARGRSARDWRVEWKTKRRDPLRRGTDWKLVMLALGTVLTLALSIYALVGLDKMLDSMHWHWMNPHEAQQSDDRGPPVIHWGGQ